MIEKERQPMTVAEARRRLAPVGRDDGTDILAIGHKTLAGGIGSRPIIAVTGIHHGFDWDQGVVFLDTEVPVQAAGEEFERERRWARSMSEKLGWMHVTLGRGRVDDPAKALADIMRILRSKDDIDPPAMADAALLAFIDRDIACYKTREERAAYRAGLSTAAELADHAARRAAEDGTVRGIVKKAAFDMSAAMRAVGDAIWRVRDRIAAE